MLNYLYSGNRDSILNYLQTGSAHGRSHRPNEHIIARMMQRRGQAPGGHCSANEWHRDAGQLNAYLATETEAMPCPTLKQRGNWYCSDGYYEHKNLHIDNMTLCKSAFNKE